MYNLVIGICLCDIGVESIYKDPFDFSFNASRSITIYDNLKLPPMHYLPIDFSLLRVYV